MWHRPSGPILSRRRRQKAACLFASPCQSRPFHQIPERMGEGQSALQPLTGKMACYGVIDEVSLLADGLLNYIDGRRVCVGCRLKLG